MTSTITIAGYGSLMNESSARETTPELSNWRYGVVSGWVRVFDLVSIINIRKNLAAGRQLTTCTARRREGVDLRVCLYDVPSSSFPALEARERRLRTERVPYTSEDGFEGEAVMFVQYSDEEYRAERAVTAELWYEEVGQYYVGKRIYRDDLLPVPAYLRRAIDAYEALGPDMLCHFLDTSFLGDGITSIRSYLTDSGDAAFVLECDPAPISSSP